MQHLFFFFYLVASFLYTNLYHNLYFWEFSLSLALKEFFYALIWHLICTKS